MNHSTLTHLSRYRGYKELGMLDDALCELENIDKEDRLNPGVLAASVNASVISENWELLADVSSQLVKQYPDEPLWWVCWANGVRRHESIEAANNILLHAMQRFPEHPDVFYCYGCNHSLMKNYKLAFAFVIRAIQLKEKLAQSAIEDEDLSDLWEHVKKNFYCPRTQTWTKSPTTWREWL